MSDATTIPNLPMPTPATPAEVMKAAAEATLGAVDACLATVVERSGSAPSTPGQKLIVYANGTAAGTVGGGGVERAVVEHMQKVLASGQGETRLVSFQLEKDLGMACGGSVQILVEPLWGSVPVLVIGAGHVGLCLAHWLPRLGFAVTLVDSRASAVDPKRLEGVPSVPGRLGRPQDVVADFPRRAAVLVATHSHDLDVEAVVWAVTSGFSYVGGVGSRSKALRVRDALVAAGADPAMATKVRMPIGLDIGARSPDEIAVSIAAELIAWRHQK